MTGQLVGRSDCAPTPDRYQRQYISNPPKISREVVAVYMPSTRKYSKNLPAQRACRSEIHLKAGLYMVICALQVATKKHKSEWKWYGCSDYHKTFWPLENVDLGNEKISFLAPGSLSRVVTARAMLHSLVSGDLSESLSGSARCQWGVLYLSPAKMLILSSICEI